MGFKESVAVREGAEPQFSAGRRNASVWERATVMSCGVLQRRWAAGLSAFTGTHSEGKETEGRSTLAMLERAFVHVSWPHESM